MKECTVGDCQRPVRARGLCPSHYERWRRNHSADLEVTCGYSDEFRQRVVECAVKEGDQIAASRYGVYAGTVGAWRRNAGHHVTRHRPAGTSGLQAAYEANVTYRQLDHWDRKGIVSPSIEARGSGSYRSYTDDDIEAVRVVGELVRFGMNPKALREYTRPQRQDLLAAMRSALESPRGVNNTAGIKAAG